MIQVNGERVKVVRMASGYLFRLKLQGVGVTGRAGTTVNRDQLRAAVRKHYLERK